MEPHRQSDETIGILMLHRVSRVLRLLIGPERDAPLPPSPTLGDELILSSVSEAQWVSTQRSGGRVYPDIDAGLVESAAAAFPDQARHTVVAADRLLRHEFNLLGSGPFAPADPDRAASGPYCPIDWRFDPVSRLRFPGGVPHKQWNFDDLRPGHADIKLPWELGRCQHLVTLGQAYRLTRLDRYAIEILDQIDDFAEANPVGVGVQWTCTMDVALRAANWTIALALVRGCAAITETRWIDAYRALFDHGTFIENNLENTYEVTSNHFLSNIAGLQFVAAVFAELPSGARWRARCREWLEQEMRTQVLDDGADYESSIPYHRLVTELFLSAARLAEFRREPLSGAFLDRLRAMCGYLAATLRPDGLMPQVGDADDGRVHILTDYGRWLPQDGRHVLAPAALMFGCPEWLKLAGESNLWEAVWWGFELPPDSRPVIQAPPPVVHFPQAGITVLRAPRVFLLITNGIVGTAGFGNHKHNDNLAFEYHFDGAAVLVDPGTYVYTSDPVSRNRFRSTGSHNTLTIDGAEQNELRPDYLFRMFEQAYPEHLAVEESEELLVYRGRHKGYQRLAEPVTHTRTFDLDRATSGLRIVDLLEGCGRHRVRWHFHCAPGVKVERTATGALEMVARGSRIEMTVPAALKLETRDDWYSPSYGVRIPCLAFDLEATIEIRDRIEYSFELRADDTSDVRH
jgi:heparinase II/III-like protein